MESLSRPLHRRKLSNASSFSGKNAYDGVFSGPRPKFDGVPAVKVEEYREIFSGGQAASSIPILDLSTLQESSDASSLELGSTMPDYGKIFGGLCDEDIAVSYEQLVARDKTRVPVSPSQGCQDLGDQSHQSFDALKQFNMSYNKISQRHKDGLDATTHVTQLHAVPGYTCFIDEATSQPKKETKKQKASIPNNIHSGDEKRTDTNSQSALEVDDDTLSKSQPFKVSSSTKDKAASQSKKETAKQKSSVTNDIHSGDIPEKQTDKNSPSAVESLSKLSDDMSFKIFQVDIKSQPLKVSSSTKDEAASQPKKENEKQKSSVTNDIHSGDIPEKQTDKNSPSAVESLSKLSDDMSFKIFQVDIKSQPLKVSSSTKDEAASQPKKENEKQKSSVTNDIHSGDIPEKQTDKNSPSAVESLSKLSDDMSFKIFQVDIKSQPLKVSSSTKDEAASQPKKENEKQKSSVTNDIHPNVNSRKEDLPARQTSQSAVESRSKYLQEESLSKKFQADINLHPSRGSSSSSSSSSSAAAAAPAASATNVDKHKDNQKRSTFTTSACFDEEVYVNSDAAASAAALRKAIEKAQESIRIAKESVGRKKEGLRSFSSKSFKDSLKVKPRVAALPTGEEQKEKDNKIKEPLVRTGVASQVSSKFADGEKLFGAKKVIDEIHGKILDSAKNPEIPTRCSHELKDSNIVCDSKEVLGSETTSSETIENSSHESPMKDNQRPNGFLVLESCEEKIGDTEYTEGMIKDEKPRESKENKDDKLAEETNNLTVYQKVEEDEKKISQGSDQNGYEKRLSEALGLLENTKQEVLEHEHDEKVASAERHEPDNNNEANESVVEEDSDTESQTEEDMDEKFYDVFEVETIQNTQTFAYSLGTNILSPKEVCQMKEKEDDKARETWENYQEPGIYENSSSDYDDAEESVSMHGCHDAIHTVIDTEEACKVAQTDDNGSSSAQVTGAFYEFPEEKEIFENISADQTASEDNDEVSDFGLADVDFEQKDALSESSSDTIHGMEIEIKEYKEKMEEESKLQESHEERPEIIFKMETGTSQEPPKVSMEKKESGPRVVVEKETQKRIGEVSSEERERERNRLAVERVIREARERAFVEARERAERAAVERATAEVRQRVMADAQEKVAKASMKASDSTASKIRAERAAVERATSEARQRALEKAMSQNKISDPKTQPNDIKQNPSSDLHVSSGTSVESALRSKAKLEKHNRIMERAAKALAEKEKRDLLVQKEQAERNRLAENLDADIKRWSSGKEGNLRALLSTLQYILGAESGWQPVSLTEIITSSAVKKAYRKATLCVHPDKLQQRGASIHHKYICEKVFDLLKAAWNRFNSEER